MTELPAIPQFETPGALRRSLRDSAYPHPTFGAAPGYLQCNLLILPHGLARDFSTFCAANPQACPVIYQSAPGQFDFPELGEDIDLRSDVGSYRVFRDGQAIGDLLDLGAYWQGDFVAFLIGSSFGLDGVLAREGIETPWIDRGETPAHYITGRESKPGGPFRGPLAVSMRPMTPEAAERTRELCATYPHLHGLPLAIGDPDELGIESLDAPVAGIDNTTRPAEGEIPVFWASALTVQLALSAARLPFCITNTPGYLLVTDVEVDALREAPLELTDRADGPSDAEAPDAETPDPELDIPAAILNAPHADPDGAEALAQVQDETGYETGYEATDEADSGAASGGPYPIAVTHLPGAPRHAAAADEDGDTESEADLAVEEDDAETLIVSGDDLAASGLSGERLPVEQDEEATARAADAGEPGAAASPEAESGEPAPDDAVDRDLFGEAATPDAPTATAEADAKSGETEGEAEAEDEGDDEDALELPLSDIVADSPLIADRPVSASRLVRERLAAAQTAGGGHHSATGAT